MQKFFFDSAPLRLCLTVHSLGPDVCLHLFGGTAAAQKPETAGIQTSDKGEGLHSFDDSAGFLGAHVGAVALALPLACDDGNSSDATGASASVLTVPGHREDLLARRLALLVARHLQKRVVLVCGIHVDNATPAIIQSLENMAHDLVQDMLEQFQNDIALAVA